MFRLTMVRHGESEANVSHMLSGWMDVELTEKGKKELIELRETINYPHSSAYFCSPLKRAVDTCHILFPKETPIISDIYKEINFHSLEGYKLETRDDIKRYFSLWEQDIPLKDEETITSVMERGKKMALDTISSCLEKGLSSATIVTHSGIMRATIIAIFSLEKAAFSKMSVANGLGYIIEFDGINPIRYYPLERKN